MSGGRVVVFASPVSATVLNEARRAIPEIYSVDGGVEGKTYMPPVIMPASAELIRWFGALSSIRVTCMVAGSTNTRPAPCSFRTHSGRR
jgi:hypothetical protein